MPPEPFPYHMTESTIGLIFKNYVFPLTNSRVQALIVQAAHKVSKAVTQNPRLRDEVLTESAEHEDEQQEILLAVIPSFSGKMTWGDLEEVFPILAAWAEEYKTPECDFEIWAWPMTGRQRYLGLGHLVLSAF